MFNRDKKVKIAKERNNTNRPEVKPEKKIGSTAKGDKPSAISVRSLNDENSIIGESVIIEGKICGSGNLIIDGLMKGDIDLEKNGLNVGPNGRVEGDIIVMDAVISGQIYGKVNAVRTINITQHADFYGEIKAKSISIDDGAFFKGKIELDREPNRNIETAGGLMLKSGDKQNKVSAMPVTESIKET
jgi:cytoskeletal protein CcmA (bactofilin family)